MRAFSAPVVICAVALALTACSSDGEVAGPREVSGSSSDLCTSQYLVLARAETRRALDQKLVTEVDRRIVSLRVQGQGEAMVPVDGPVEVVDLLTRRGRRAIQADVFREPDGQWFAGEWSQCTD